MTVPLTSIAVALDETRQTHVPRGDRWQEHGACTEAAAPDVWFADEDAPETTQAQEICRTRCGVIRRCLEHAYAVREPAGVWGGLTTSAREKVRRQTIAEKRKAS